MLAALFRAADNVRSSFWFLPAIMGLAAASAAVGAVNLDRGIDAAALDWLFGEGAPGASAFLAVLAGTIITVLGVAFSITIVALVLASAQFGPRLLRTFMRDRANQTVLGIVVATFLYALVALALDDPEIMGDSGARITVIIGLILGIASIAAFVFFLHHLANQMQADIVVHRAARELMHQIDQYFPDVEKAQGPAPKEALRSWTYPLSAATSGYIQVIDVKRLLRLAQKHDLVMRVPRRPGQFILEGQTIIDLDRPVNNEIASKLQETITLGPRRTEQQDLELTVDQLVEVAIRAINSSLNDPYTAQRVVDRLSQGFCRLAKRSVPLPYLYEDGRFRLEVARPDFRHVAERAFAPLREFACGSSIVMERLFENMQIIGECTPEAAHRQILKQHADQILADSRREISNPADVERLEQLHGDIVRLASPAP